MKKMLKFNEFIDESASKINPGKQMIKASVAGAPSAKKYVTTAKKVLGELGKKSAAIADARKEKDRDEVKKLKDEKKEMVSKLIDLKKEVTPKYREQYKMIPKDKKAGAAEKAEPIAKAFTDAIKRRVKKDAAEGSPVDAESDKEEKKAKDTESDKEEKAKDAESDKEEKKEEKPDVDTDALKEEMDKIKDEINSLEKEAAEEWKKEEKEWEDQIDSAIADRDREEEGSSEWENINYDIMDWSDQMYSAEYEIKGKYADKIQALADKYDALEQKLEAAEGQNESYIWEAVDRILEFDAQAKADAWKEKAEDAKKKAEDAKDGGGDDEGDVKKDEAKLKSMMAAYQKKAAEGEESGRNWEQSREGQMMMGDIEDMQEKVKKAGGDDDQWPRGDEDPQNKPGKNLKDDEDEDDEDDEKDDEKDDDKDSEVKQEEAKLKSLMAAYLKAKKKNEDDERWEQRGEAGAMMDEIEEQQEKVKKLGGDSESWPNESFSFKGKYVPTFENYVKLYTSKND